MNENPAPVGSGACAVAGCMPATSGTEITGSAASVPSTRRRLGLLDDLDDGMTVIPWIERVKTTCMHFAAIGAQRQIFSNFQVIAVATSPPLSRSGATPS